MKKDDAQDEEILSYKKISDTSTYQEEFKSVTSVSYYLKQPEPEQAPDNIQWYTETMKIDGFHEAFEWVTSGPSLEIGYMYTGYKTTNEYLAHVLLFELIRLDKAAAPRSRVRADYEWTSEGLLYKVWITPVTPEADNK